MIKSVEEMKNNSIHHSNLLKLPIKCQICKYLSRTIAVLSESERYVLGPRECTLTCTGQGGSAQTFFGIPKKINTRKNQTPKK